MIDVGVMLAVLLAQKFEQRGFVENSTVVYPKTAPNDSGRVVDELSEDNNETQADTTIN